MRSDVFGLGVVLREAVTGRSAPGRSGNGGTSALLDVAARATAASPEDRHPDVQAFLSDLRAAAGRHVAIPSTDRVRENPYKGLRPFGEQDAATFFGRGRLVERLVNRLGTPGAQGRFVLLVGPSGSGKSSVIKAGLLPALRRGAAPGSSSWFVAEMTPGASPFEALEAALRTVAVDPPATLLDQLLADERGLRSVLPTVLPDPDAQLLLVVDQFEELFTQTEDGRPASRSSTRCDSL